MNKIKQYQSFDAVPADSRVVVLGNFDGLHRGHQTLIRLGRQLASEKNLPLMVFTFFPQFQSFVNPEFKYILSQKEKTAHLEELGVDEVLSVPFEQEIGSCAPEAFVKHYLLQVLRATDIVVGYNFTFGFKAQGKAEDLKYFANPATVHVVPAYRMHGNVVSSTQIREALREGQMERVTDLLGHPYMLSGEVIHGLANGRRFLVPTANVSLESHVLLPKPGVYVAKCYLSETPDICYASVLNIGTRPTIDDNPVEMVEAHLLDFDQDIYGRELCVEVLHYLRGIEKYDGLPALKEAIQKDILAAKDYFSEREKQGVDID